MIDPIDPIPSSALIETCEPILRAIYVDFGGVVAQPDRQLQLDFLVKELGFSGDALFDSPYFRWMQLHPEEREYLSQIALKNGILMDEGDWERYRVVKRCSVRPVLKMFEIISALRQMGHEVNLVTNIRSENLDLIQPYISWFDHVVHCPKDPGQRKEAWEMEWLLHHFDPSLFLLIDDQGVNVDEAVQLGMQAIQFQDAAALRVALLNLGIEIK